jgi:hypothetical protein
VAITNRLIVAVRTEPAVEVKRIGDAVVVTKDMNFSVRRQLFSPFRKQMFTQ